MFKTAQLTGYRVSQDGTELKMFIPNVNLQDDIIKRRVKQVDVWLEDGRHITAEQRKKAYATITDIALHTGYMLEECKELMKYYHIIKTGCQYFSLSDCSIQLAREFINTLLEYALENGIILSDVGLNRTDDIEKYLYMCIKYRKCCICGKPNSDVHHVTGSKVGMGNDRTKAEKEERDLVCLCRHHHNICHNDEVSFFDRYHIYGISYKLK